MNVRTEFRFSALGLSLGANPVFRTFWFVQRLRVGSSSNLKSRISGSLPNMWNDEIFQKSIFSTRVRDHFWRDMGANPVFWTFEVVQWWNLVCMYSMWPGVWMLEPNFDFRPWAFLLARTTFFGLFDLSQPQFCPLWVTINFVFDSDNHGQVSLLINTLWKFD